MAFDKFFDVFLSHNSADKEAVEALARRLVDEAGLRPFLDKWHLVPGNPWQEDLEQALGRSRTCAVFIGSSGIGPWENEEMRSALDTRVRHANFRVVPVILPGATIPKRGTLPRFLSRITWVDFRKRDGVNDTEAFHRLVAGIRGVPPGRDDSAIFTTSDIECPYRGLEIFDEAHARFFFGREAITQHMVEALRKSRFLAVLGPSGSGKSSVVRAGLLPQLRSGALPFSSTWHYLVFKPGAHPLEELAVSLAHAQKMHDVLGVLKSLETDERELHLSVRLGLRDRPQETRFCFIVDQFEETFTLCQEQTERDRFVQLLRYAATIAGGQTVIILTMRADFTARAAEYTPLAELLSTHPFLLSPMDHDDLRRAIEEPAQMVGLRLEKGFVEAIVRDVGNEPGALPFMEHALLQLWEKRHESQVFSIQTYNDIGGVQGALAKRADELFDTLTVEQQHIARRILMRLTQPGEGTEDTRRRTSMQELWTWTAERHRVEEVVKTLTDARLLVTSKDEQVEVAHEALIRGWPRLRRWIDDDRAMLHVHRRITEAAQEWQRLQRDEGVLYRGALLSHAQEWREQHAVYMNQLEREFLDASVTLKRRVEEEDRKRQRHELEQARALVEEQMQRAEIQTRASRRFRSLASGLAVVLLCAIIAALFAIQQTKLARQEARRADVQSSIAEQKTAEAEQEAALATSRRLAVEAFSHTHDQLDLALILSLEALRKANTLEARSSLLTGVEHAPHLRTLLHGHTDGVTGVAFDSVGTTLISSSHDGTILLWDVDAGQPRGQPLRGHTRSVTSVAFSPNGTTAASGSQDGSIRLWDVATGQLHGQPLFGYNPGEVSMIYHDRGWVTSSSEVQSVAFSPKGSIVASATGAHTVLLWDVTDTANVRPYGPPLSGHEDNVISVAFSPDGTTLASGSRDRTIRLWDVATGQLRYTFSGHKEFVLSVVFSPDGTLLASSSRDKTIRLWNVATGQLCMEPLFGHKDAVTSVAFSPDGTILISGSRDGTVRLWDVATGQSQKRSFTGHKDGVTSLAFSPDGSMIAAGSGHGTIFLWEAAAYANYGRKRFNLGRGVTSVAVSSNSTAVAACDQEGTVRLWEAATGRLIGPANIPNSDLPGGLAFSRKGKILAVGTWRHIHLLDVTTGKLRYPSIHYPGTAFELTMAFSPDGRKLAAGASIRSISNTSRIYLWDVETIPPAVQVFETTKEGFVFNTCSLAFSPDGAKLAMGSCEKLVGMGPLSTCVRGEVRLWDVATGRPHDPFLVAHNDLVSSVAFSPNGRILASGSDDNTILLWNLDTGQPRDQSLDQHKGGITSLAFSPDGSTLASSSRDSTIRLWDVATNSPLGPPLQFHTSVVLRIVFSPDGNTLLSVSEDGIFHLWQAGLDSWRNRACQIANRNLTCSEWRQYFGDERDVPYHATCPNLPLPECPHPDSGYRP